jgi:hypothetical protein
MLKKILQDTIQNPNLVLPTPSRTVKSEPTVEELVAKAAANPKKNKVR